MSSYNILHKFYHFLPHGMQCNSFFWGWGGGHIGPPHLCSDFRVNSVPGHRGPWGQKIFLAEMCSNKNFEVVRKR